MKEITSNGLKLQIIRVIKKNLDLTSTGSLKHISYAIHGHKIISNSICGCSNAGTKHILGHRCFSAHSEMNTAKCIQYMKKKEKITIVVARCRKNKDGELEFLMSRPCIKCATMMKKLRINKVIYTIPDGLVSEKPQQILRHAIPSFADRTTRKTLYVKIDAHRRITNGKKKVELRIPKKFTQTMHKGTLINISNGVGELVVAKIINIVKYRTDKKSAAPLIRRVLRKEGVHKIIPHIDDIHKGVRYLLYDGGKNNKPVFNWEQVVQYGIWAFELDVTRQYI